MSATRLSLAQFARALERYDGRYSVFEVFADDVEELHTLARGGILDPALDANPDADGLLFSVDDERYRIMVTERSAIARITRAADAPAPPMPGKPLERVIWRAIGLATSAKGEGWMPGLVVGVLGGTQLEQGKERTITVRYNPDAREWRAYGGPMSQWLRQTTAAVA
jgi:hypothetical protein